MVSMGQSKNKTVSVVVPAYNEKNAITRCVRSLASQTYRELEIIVVDDGSDDGTYYEVKPLTREIRGVRALKQRHKGPGEARNLGASHAKGKVLVFVDADMIFDKNFIKNLVEPIVNGRALGTDSQNEYLGNPENYWARSWNIGRFAALGNFRMNAVKNMVPDIKNFGGIFRAVLKSEFNRVGGFEPGGDYTDDESLGKKLGVKAVLVWDAIFYHYNPSTVVEVWQRASWIGAGRNFTGTFRKKIVNLIKFSVPVSIIKAMIIAARYKYPEFVFFKLMYDTAVWVSVLRSTL